MDIFIGFISFIGGLGFFIATVFFTINLIKRKSRKKPVIASVICFVLLIIGGMSTDEPASKALNTEKIKKEQQSEEKTEKEEITFNLKSAKYNTENEGVDVVVEAPDLPDGTKVSIEVTNEISNENVQDMGNIVRQSNTSKIKDGKLKVNVGATEEGDKYSNYFQNGLYKVEVIIYVEKSTNEHLLDKWGNLEDFKDKYSVVDGEVEKTDEGYRILVDKLDEFEITEGYTAE